MTIDGKTIRELNAARVPGGMNHVFANRFNRGIRFAPEDGSGGGAGDGASDGADGESDGAHDGSGGEAADEAGKNDKGPSAREKELEAQLNKAKKDADKFKKDLANTTAKLKSFEGIDPEAVKTLLAKQKEDEKKVLESKGEFDRLRQMMADEHKKELEGYTGRLSEMETKLNQANSLVNRLTIGNAFTDSKFIREELVLTPTKARVVYGDHFDIDDDGKVVAYDKPKGDSARTPLVNGRGDPLPFEEAIKKIVESDPDRDQILKSKLRQGAGSGGKDVKTEDKGSEATGLSRIAEALRARTTKK
jgi:hypothetical protein